MQQEDKIRELQVFAQQIRVETIRALATLGFGHTGGTMSVTEALAVLYGDVFAQALFKHILGCFTLGFREELERLLARGGEPRHKKRDLSGIQRHSQYSERMNTVNFKSI